MFLPFDVSRSIRVTFNGAFEFLMYDFLRMFTGNIDAKTDI